MLRSRTSHRWLPRFAVLAAIATVLVMSIGVTAAFADASFTTAPAPTIVGEAGVGQTLAAVPGAYSPTPDYFTYQWYADGVAVDGETGPTYVVGVPQTCLPITVEVTAHKAGYTPVTGVSDATALCEPFLGYSDISVAPTPTIAGTPAVDQTLTATTGSWSPTPTLFTYQWFADGSAISTATASSYHVGADQLGKKISVQVIGYASGYNSTYRLSPQTAAITQSFTTVPVPTITGTPTVGLTLTAVTGTWTPTPDSFAYQWYADSVAIGGSTNSTYAVDAGVVGKQISVRVTGSKSGYTSVSTTSAATAAVSGPAPTNFTTAPNPTITGTPIVGQTLTAVNGAWTPTPDSFGYQWYADNVAIGGATGSTYPVTAAVLGKKISVQVTGTKAGYNSAARTSAQTAIVTGVFTSAPVPTISGTAAVGKTLKVATGAWNPAPTTFTYQWYASGKKIAGATKNSFKLTKTQKGKTITVTVTAAKANYATLTKTSKATAKVK